MPGSVATVGYPDDQAVNNWDEGTVTYASLAHNVGTVTSPGIPCSRYSALYIFHKQTTVQSQITAWYYHDSTLTRTCGSRQFQWDPTIQNGVELQLPNLGPFVQIVAVPNGGGAWTDQTIAILNNRVIPYGTLPSGQVVQSQGQNLTAGQSIAQILSYIGMGPTSFYTNGGTQGVNILLETLDSTFTWVRFCNWSVATGVDDYRNVTLPTSAIRYTLTNQSGVNPCNNIRYSIVTPVSGST